MIGYWPIIVQLPRHCVGSEEGESEALRQDNARDEMLCRGNLRYLTRIECGFLKGSA